MNTCLPGGIALTRLRVYDQHPGPDGVDAGCAHVHALSDEAYYCLAGEGAVELHDPESGFVRHPMGPGSYLQFPPGTLHRSVSYRACEFLVIMGNGGLPEHGDARIYFGPEVDADPEAYLRFEELVADGLQGALRRRDASALAYGRLLRLWETDRDAYRAEIARFCDLHRRQVAADRDAFRSLILEGVGAALDRGLERVRSLPAVSGSQPIRHLEMAHQGEVLGMCGVLRQVTPSSTPLTLVGREIS